MITKEYLENYKIDNRNYDFEIEKIQKQIMFEYKNASADSVVGSTTTVPYIKRNIGISGINRRKIKKLEKRKDIFEKRKEKLNKELKYKLDNLKDRIVADIIEKRFVKNWSWNKISEDMKFKEESGARKTFDRYFEKNKSCPFMSEK